MSGYLVLKLHQKLFNSSPNWCDNNHRNSLIHHQIGVAIITKLVWYIAILLEEDSEKQSIFGHFLPNTWWFTPWVVKIIYMLFHQLSQVTFSQFVFQIHQPTRFWGLGVLILVKPEMWKQNMWEWELKCKIFNDTSDTGSQKHCKWEWE